MTKRAIKTDLYKKWKQKKLVSLQKLNKNEVFVSSLKQKMLDKKSLCPFKNLTKTKFLSQV